MVTSLGEESDHLVRGLAHQVSMLSGGGSMSWEASCTSRWVRMVGPATMHVKGCFHPGSMSAYGVCSSWFCCFIPYRSMGRVDTPSSITLRLPYR